MKNSIRISVGVAALLSAAALANAQTEGPSPRGGANYESQALGQDRATETPPSQQQQGAEEKGVTGGPRTGLALEGKPGRAGHNGYAVNGGPQRQHPNAQRPYTQHPFAQHPYAPQPPAQRGLEGRAIPRPETATPAQSTQPGAQGTLTPAQPGAQGALEKQAPSEPQEQMPGEPRAQGSALISPDQEAGIRDSVRNDRSAHADFGLAVGSVVPRGQRLAILPDDAVSIAPRFRGYKFVIVEDEIVIVDPRTYRVAAVIPEAGGPGLEPGGPDVEPGGPSLEPRGPGVEPGGRIPETGNPAPGPSGPGGCARC